MTKDWLIEGGGWLIAGIILFGLLVSVLRGLWKSRQPKTWACAWCERGGIGKNSFCPDGWGDVQIMVSEGIIMQDIVCDQCKQAVVDLKWSRSK